MIKAEWWQMSKLLLHFRQWITTFELKCLLQPLHSFCLWNMKSLNTSKHSFLDLWLPQPNFVCSHDFIRMMNIISGLWTFFYLDTKTTVVTKNRLRHNGSPFPWNYPRQSNRIVRYYTQLLWNFVHHDCFWELHYGKEFTQSSWFSEKKIPNAPLSS